jgi:HAD-hyrolase-like
VRRSPPSGAGECAGLRGGVKGAWRRCASAWATRCHSMCTAHSATGGQEQLPPGRPRLPGASRARGHGAAHRGTRSGRPGSDEAELVPRRTAAHAIGQPLTRCLPIGDQPTDIQAAQAVGAASIGYANKPGKSRRRGRMRCLLDVRSIDRYVHLSPPQSRFRSVYCTTGPSPRCDGGLGFAGA